MRNLTYEENEELISLYSNFSLQDWVDQLLSNNQIINRDLIFSGLQKAIKQATLLELS